MDEMLKESYMRLAIKEAQRAEKKDEVPIGAIIVKDGKIIGKGYNRRNSTKIATHHAEIIAIEKACKHIGDWRLENAVMFVTLEPCPMCAGAIANARISKVIFGAFDKTSNDSLCSKILSSRRLNHTTKIEGAFMQKECENLLTNFFQKKRGKVKK